MLDILIINYCSKNKYLWYYYFYTKFIIGLLDIDGDSKNGLVLRKLSVPVHVQSQNIPLWFSIPVIL